MPTLIRAAGPVLEQILDETFPLWGDGLSRRAYGQWNQAQEQTEWGRGHLRRLALMDGHRLLASAKRYDLTLRLDGRERPTLGIGAVFTPAANRGRGYARAVIAALESEARRDGAEASLLFSEIGSSFYESLGYRRVPVSMADLVVDVRPGAPAVVVRTGDDRDAEDIAGLYAQRGREFRLSLSADAWQVRHAVVRKRLLAGFDSTGRRAVDFHVVEEGQRAVAFVLVQVARSAEGLPDRWSLAACGDRDPGGVRIGALLQVLLARAPSVPHPLIRAWWPMSLRPPQLRVMEAPAPGEMMMIKPLDGDLDEAMALDAGDVLYWHGDAF
jgi:GNAT superfamily N-acetyltransferase